MCRYVVVVAVLGAGQMWRWRSKLRIHYTRGIAGDRIGGHCGALVLV